MQIGDDPGVGASALSVRQDVLRYRGLDGAAELTFYLDGKRPPEIDGKAVKAESGN